MGTSLRTNDLAARRLSDSRSADCALRAQSGPELVAGDATNWSSRSPDRTRRPRESPNSRIALPTIASNTGCTSVGELLMTLRISAVAVCRSSASLVSLNRRTFSIAITAWSAKVLQQRDLVRRERLRARAVTLIAADGAIAFAHHRHDEMARSDSPQLRLNRALAGNLRASATSVHVHRRSRIAGLPACRVRSAGKRLFRRAFSARPLGLSRDCR